MTAKCFQFKLSLLSFLRIPPKKNLILSPRSTRRKPQKSPGELCSQKCCHSLSVGKQIRGLIQGFYKLTSRFEPRHAALFDVGDFLPNPHFLRYEGILFGGVFRCG